MYKDTPRSVSQIRRFVTERGDDYLQRFDEEPVEGAEWLYSSHGAVIRVVGEYDNIFERLLVVVPRPREAPPERFQSWVKERLEAPCVVYGGFQYGEMRQDSNWGHSSDCDYYA